MTPRTPLDMAALRRRIAAGGGYGGAGGRGAASTSTTTAAPALADDEAEIDPADHIDDEIIESARWMDTEIAVGAVVAILLVAALVAVWISFKRRRRLRPAESPAGTDQGTARAAAQGTVVQQLQTVHEVKKKQLNRMNTFSFKPPKPQVKVGVTPPAGEANGNGHPVTTIVLPSTPSPDLSPNPNGGLDVEGGVGPWEPYLLGVGLPAKKMTRARRRSVSLRSGDDEGSSDGDSSLTATPSRGPSPSLGRAEAADGDAEPAARKRSVTFNNMVEEVQILVR